MGLCKCPKRQVTNQFCFEHRVNVCETCMVTSHPKCIVQSYLQWLKDSDYVSTCTLCRNDLESEDCIRLICYHVFHFHCLNEEQSNLPSNTGPGGHVCPSCKHPIFPPSNLISPVADVLRNRLGQVNWGRNELGLALLSEKNVEQQNKHTTSVHHIHKSLDQNLQAIKTKLDNGELMSGNTQKSSPHSVLLMESFNPPSADLHANSRRQFLPRQSPIGSSDRDDNKYKRRTPAEIFSRWSRRFYAPSSRPPWRRTWFLVLIGLIFFAVITYLLFTIGRSSNFNDAGELENNPFVNHRNE